MDIAKILDKKWYGGLYHLHDTADTWEQWNNEFYDLYEYPTDVEEKLVKIFSNNVQHIREKTIIDLACNLGYLTLAASNLGAVKSVGLEIRDEYINTFNKVVKHWPKQNVELKKANIECLADLEAHLVGVDTIIYSGHFYHTSRHTDLIKLFTDSQATCLILESTVPQEYVSDGYHQGTETTKNPLNGFVDEFTDTIKIKAPTLEKSISLLEDFGWKITSYDTTKFVEPQRYIITAIKDNQCNP
jgi:predicted RNA methylase